jgi:hypothetical protein
MPALESLEIPLGTLMPKFSLLDPYGTLHGGEESIGAKGMLVVFTCNHCPYSKSVWPRLIRLSEYARANDVNVLAINPNINPKYPEDSPGMMRTKIQEWGITFPYLVDDVQHVAREFKAQCTPDIYLFDAAKKLVYHGRIDDNWQDESKVTRRDLKDALYNLVAGKPIAEKQFPSIGCSIKWMENTVELLYNF